MKLSVCVAGTGIYVLAEILREMSIKRELTKSLIYTLSGGLIVSTLYIYLSRPKNKVEISN